MLFLTELKYRNFMISILNLTVLLLYLCVIIKHVLCIYHNRIAFQSSVNKNKKNMYF